jgi:hypothetical protein
MACKDSVDMKIGSVMVVVLALLGFVSFLLGFSLLTGLGMDAIDERAGEVGVWVGEEPTKTKDLDVCY